MSFSLRLNSPLLIFITADYGKKDALKMVKFVFSPSFRCILNYFFIDIQNYLNLFTTEQTCGEAYFLIFETVLSM